MKERIGFIQGRLSPLVDGKIQAFPVDHWEEEFSIANDLSLNIMEWTLDQHNLYDCPLMSAEGRQDIKNLMNKFHVSIPSLTGDCFMQEPFYKTSQQQREDSLISDLNNILNNSHDLGVKFIVFPLVDNGSIQNKHQKERLLNGLSKVEKTLQNNNQKIVFESDYSPTALKEFIQNFSSDYYGINYDIGNSAALGFDSEDEIKNYGERILNVHIKDRILNGTTVPLGTGNANLPHTLNLLKKINYSGNYILQTARDSEGRHSKALLSYKNMTLDWLK